MTSIIYLICLVAVKANKYCSINCGGDVHTMCMYEQGGGRACQGYRSGLADSEKKLIVNVHNQLRQKVANGEEERGPQPPAANMMELTWDKELQAIAQRWADQCDKKGHDKCSDTLDGVYVGQNIATGWLSRGMKEDRKENISQAIQGWYDEVALFPSRLVDKFRVENNFLQIGHYSQLAWAATTKVGCGILEKKDKYGLYPFKIVCNYKVGANMAGESVYKRGAACSACPARTSCSSIWPGLCA